jgi:ABC-2 type transport system ATP-binding protein
MKKKLALACALIHDPEVILLDEPTTGVDPVTRRDFWVILADLLADGLTIVVATPYLDEAERCERVALLQDGVFLAFGEPEQLKGRIPGRLFEVITSQPRRARAALSSLDDSRTPGSARPGVLEVQVKGDRIHVRTPASHSGEPIRTIREAMERNAIPMASLRETAPTLENVYVSLMSGETEEQARG